MAIQITIDAIVSGTPPYNVWVTDNCGNAGVSQYINTFSTSAYTFTLPTVFETYPIYYVKIIDANNCQYCISPPIENCNIFVGSWDTNSYYKYNLVSDTDENITFSTPPQIDDSIFGNTDNKIWFRTNTGITEYNITITPFTESYNREIVINLSQIRTGYVIDNSNVVVCAYNSVSGKTFIHDAIITGTTAQTTSLLEVVGSLSGGSVGVFNIKDIKVSTQDKIIVMGFSGSNVYYLQQYNYATSGSLELEIPLSGITNPASLIEVNDKFYVLNNSNQVYEISLTPPYLITFDKTSTTPIGFGKTSQKYGCITQKFEI